MVGPQWVYARRGHVCLEKLAADAAEVSRKTARSVIEVVQKTEKEKIR